MVPRFRDILVGQLRKNMRDFQRQKVYDWERAHIAPRCSRIIPRANVQTVIDGIWMAHGLLYPPVVDDMPGQVRRKRADANRLTVRFAEEHIPLWVVVHELAHSMTWTIDSSIDKHGPNFMGMYLKLLDKVCNIPLCYTMFTLQSSPVKYDLTATPIVERMV